MENHKSESQKACCSSCAKAKAEKKKNHVCPCKKKKASPWRSLLKKYFSK